MAGCNRKTFDPVVSIGIGGSYLGPEFVYEALRTDTEGSKSSANRILRFLANIDPIDVARQLNGLDPETTLVVVVSKTFTTAETMLNARTLRNWLISSISSANPTDVIRQHIIAVSAAPEKAVEFGIDQSNVFGFWDWVGGRYSVCSAVGTVPLSLHFGFNLVEKFLAGAHNIDQHFLTTPLEQNIPVLIGLFGVWNSSFLNFPSRAILPYSQALVRFAAHIQQVEMESNGKQVKLDGR
jgi:glucose-6-phosphate isomerase